MGGGAKGDPFAGMGGFGGMGGGGGSRSRAGGGMPGMSGMGGMGGMGGMPGFGGGMPGGFGMGEGGPSSPGGSPAAKPADWEKPLPVALEDLYKGAKRKMKISRKTASGVMEDNVIEVDIKPGWKPGTKVRFAGKGSEQPSGPAQDLVFVIEQKPHATFRREGDDLHVTQTISLLDALDPPQGGSTRRIGSLDGRTINVPLPTPGPGKTSIENGKTTRITGGGMPISKSGGAKKGDLVVEWKVELPSRLTEQQRRNVRTALA